MKAVVAITWACMFTFCTSSAQKPDFELDPLYTSMHEVSHSVSQWTDHAAVKLYSNDQHINILVEVYDDVMMLAQDFRISDHIDLWFALPSEAYPENFSFSLHPEYIYSQDTKNGKGYRFFSIYPEYSHRVELEKFKNRFDYPNIEFASRKGYHVPLPRSLQKTQVDYGMVKFALPLDRLEPVLLNRENHRLWEKSMRIHLGDIEEGLTYTLDPWDKGYVVNIQIAPKALGFIMLPQMDKLLFRVDIYDVDSPDRPANRMSTSRNPMDEQPSTFAEVKLSKPLNTNHSNIPDNIFYKSKFFPLSIYTRNGWVESQVDTDVLIISDQIASRYLTEVLFDRLTLDFTEESLGGQIVGRLFIRKNFVNEISRSREIISAMGSVISGEQSLAKGKLLDNDRSSFFRFPNGDLGFMLIERTVLDPYEWGMCKDCLDESVNIYRISNGKVDELLNIYQIKAQEVFCRIGIKTIENFYISDIDWIQKGRIMILRLNHIKFNLKRRIKVSWDYNGENVKVEEVI